MPGTSKVFRVLSTSRSIESGAITWALVMELAVHKQTSAMKNLNVVDGEGLIGDMAI
jgi:hypothetical protein